MIAFVSPLRMLFWGLVFAGSGGFMAYHNWQQNYAGVTVVVPLAFAGLGILLLVQSMRIAGRVLRAVLR